MSLILEGCELLANLPRLGCSSFLLTLVISQSNDNGHSSIEDHLFLNLHCELVVSSVSQSHSQHSDSFCQVIQWYDEFKASSL